MGNANSSDKEEDSSNSPSHIADGAVPASSVSAVEQAVNKTTTQNIIIDRAISDSKAILNQHGPTAQLGTKRGFLSELHHEATFNLNAFGKEVR
jgi:hypothetical protein